MDSSNKKILAGCFYAFFINGITALIIGAIMPEILADFNMGYNQGGMLLSFQSMGNLIASFFSGMIFLYLGNKTGIVLLSSMTALGFLGMTLTKSPVFLLLPFFLTGLGRGSVTNMSNTIVNDVGDGRPGPLNILHTFFAVGAFMAPFFAAWSIGKGFSWRFILRVVSALALLMVLTYSRMKISNKPSRNKEETKTNTSLSFLKNIDFYLSSGILFFYVGVEYAVNGWIVTYLKDTGIMSTSLAQNILSILWIVIIFGRLFAAYISKTVDKKTILLVSSTGALVFFGLFLISTSIWAIVACILGLGFFLSGIYPTTVSNVGSVLKESSMAMGTLLAVAGLGGILMPYITGVVAEKVGIAGGMTAIGIAAFMMFVFTLVNKLRPNRPKEA
ncbi:MAG: MFS transporter [Tissierellia bacterium]|nr:MFS transporter [Tissierellia bacterium]